MSPWHQHTARIKELSRACAWCRLVSLHTLGGTLTEFISGGFRIGDLAKACENLKRLA